MPLIASTYYNLVLHDGPEEFCAALRRAGVTGLIVPDLPVHEADELMEAAAACDIEPALLASPTTPDARLAEIGARSRGFVYAVSVMGTTGERTALAASAARLAARLKNVTDLPLARIRHLHPGSGPRGPPARRRRGGRRRRHAARARRGGTGRPAGLRHDPAAGPRPGV